ncbi:extracellular solute-binding protein [Actinomadura graeca]|uniref:Extracellular solute-binding protein n=1 Tax=Actinomadura graeca TaxID=2750812 RepID=A0ABX8QTD2_9ACTN|nr:extracellular solute-binding protein [Actinomadura graeca]QXJ20063.1 extracellular solute-binding protein [Actinomadura graeca]
MRLAPGTGPDTQHGYLLFALAGAVITLVALLGAHVLSSDTGRCKPGEKLVVLGGRDDSGARGSLIGAWPGSHGMKAEFQELPSDTDLEHSEVVSAARSGTCRADVYIVDTPWIPEFAKAGYIDPVGIPERELRPIMPKILATTRYRGDLWAVPLNTDAPLLLYRKDLVGNVPQDRKRLMADASTLANTPGSRLGSGLALQLRRYEGLTVNLLELVRDHGGDITVGEDGKVTIGREAVGAALRELSSGFQGAHPAIRPASLDSNEDKDRAAFEDGEVAFMRNWPTQYTLISNNGKLKPWQIGAVPFPGERVLGGQSLAIAASLPDGRARAARDLLRYITDREQQRRLFACGGWASVRADVYRLGAGDCAGQGTSHKRIVLHADAQVIYQAVAGARPRPSSPYYPEFSRELRARVHAQLTCMATTCAQLPDQGLGKFLDELPPALEQAARGRMR